MERKQVLETILVDKLPMPLQVQMAQFQVLLIHAMVSQVAKQLFYLRLEAMEVLLIISKAHVLVIVVAVD